MILSDDTIWRKLQRGHLRIEPLSGWQVQPASVDLRLGSEFLVPRRWFWQPMDRLVKVECRPFYLKPRSFVLATTIERVELPDNLQGSVDGRSSIGRMGLFVENAGFIDPGFCGQITLELFNASNNTLPLYPGMRICQLSLTQLDQPAASPYRVKGHYQDQRGVRASRYHAGCGINHHLLQEEARAGWPLFWGEYEVPGNGRLGDRR